MKHDFILDENVLQASLNCSQTANRILLEISKNCHGIVVETSLYASYWKSLKKYRSSAHHPYVQPVLSAILHDSTKCRFLVGPFKDAALVPVRHRKDVFLAQLGLAASGEAFIVSSDAKTRADLKKIGLKALTLREALAQAMNKSQ